MKHSSEQQAFVAASGAYQDGFYTLAIDQLTDFLAQYPNSNFAATASFLLGDSYFRLKKYARSIYQLEKLL
ncbi:MAG: tetratricopeptide repeat protein, partial [bacterium]|nr:tetratricopeptide repeat protein [bacterium]